MLQRVAVIATTQPESAPYESERQLTRRDGPVFFVWRSGIVRTGGANRCMPKGRCIFAQNSRYVFGVVDDWYWVL